MAGRRGTLRSMVKGSVVKPVSTILEQILEDNPQAESEYLGQLGQPKPILHETQFGEANT